jgi:hypothetical protein
MIWYVQLERAQLHSSPQPPSVDIMAIFNTRALVRRNYCKLIGSVLPSCSCQKVRANLPCKTAGPKAAQNVIFLAQPVRAVAGLGLITATWTTSVDVQQVQPGARPRLSFATKFLCQHWGDSTNAPYQFDHFDHLEPARKSGFFQILEQAQALDVWWCLLHSYIIDDCCI